MERIQRYQGRPLRFMEFCGGHTHAIMRYGLRQLVAPAVRAGLRPGLPGVRHLERGPGPRHRSGRGARALILATFGDMLRVPGSRRQPAGGPGARRRRAHRLLRLDALDLARKNPDRPVVMLGVGFETTAPTIAASLLQAEAENLDNFYVLSLHKLTPPAMRAILDAGEVRWTASSAPGT